MTFLRTLAAALLLLSAPAFANDSEAEWAVGGLVLKSNDQISMDSEDLFISAEEVRVDYIYTNHADRDQDVVIAFPLPALPIADNGYADPYAYPDWDEFGFATTVDGDLVGFDQIDRAVVGARDVTDFVVARGWPIHWYRDESFVDRLNALPPAERDAAHALGLLTTLPDAELVIPAWKGQRYMLRVQTFPAGKSVRVGHRYTPIAGGSVGGMLYPSAREDMPEAMAEYRTRWCIDDSFLSGVDRRLTAHGADETVYYSETWLGYVLSSGANWRGPIKNFRLVVDKGSPDNLVSFCMNGVRKISPTQFEVVKKDFEPTGDLNILITGFHKVDE
ncbi:DUF4424 family protein [Pontixanthobacter aquaemixtae]|uniref:DUF4424 domain-containing protein n=1 Tax=Pontixanthobacter aquaemixtae TaxID=1958940 RepID=A0A844ZZD8_9SPHN|nr:DUF4424 family protein [Pontixanthobacter aquaemixtae]MXO90799.1 DUF4424 domain-containing protein [Pontixanthobacter aquaemixtae]